MENHLRRDSGRGGAWDRVLEALRPQVSASIFDTWFRPTRLLSMEGDLLRVQVPNTMFAEWLQSQYLETIRATLPKVGLPSAELVFVVRDEDTSGSSSATPPKPAPYPSPRLNPRYTFENFVVSSCNQFAHAAALATTDQLGGAYNPLFIYGGVGLGKTHLMQAIGNRWLSKQPGIRLSYVTSEQFINELITAIRFEKTPEFRARYRSVDVLLVDDIQFIAGKESTQEEFFHTFNALYDAGQQIVLASDAPPRSIPSLAERLRSRFEWGLIADIQPPDLETKVAILNKIAASKGWQLQPEVALYIAGQIQSNIRELEGCLTTLIASASIQRRTADLAFAREVVHSMSPAEEEPVTLEEILRAVARHFNLRVADLKSRTNARRIAFPRQIAMYLGKKLARESYPTIGQIFGGKHHTTVLHAVRKIDRLRSEDPSIHRTLAELEARLG